MVCDPILRKQRYLGIRDIARQLNIGVNQVVAHIRGGTIKAIDVRKPGACRPFFKVAIDELRRFEKAMEEGVVTASQPDRGSGVA